jgi:iron complex outermembrane receptor protein
MRRPLRQPVATTRLVRGLGGLARASFLAVALSLCIFGPLRADDVHVPIRKPTSIPAQPLGPALQALASQRNFQVVFVSEDVNSLRTQGAMGELTQEEALQQLLRGTGLSYRYLDEMTVIITAVSAGSNASVPPAQSAQPNVPPEHSGTLRSNAIAASPADELLPEEITVTGSRLHLGRAAIASPLTVITQQQIETMGFNTVEDVITSLPEIYSGINAATTLYDGLTPTGAQGQSAADLRGLGPENTLILVDGRRRAVSPLFADLVNLNTIPMGSVERIEVMTDGASAVYGSDAVAGVINFILKKNFEGTQTRLRQELGHNGGDSISLDQTVGEGWSSGDFTFSGRYARSNPVNSHRAGYITSDYSNIGGDDWRVPGIGQPGVVQGLGALPPGDNGTHGIAGQLSPANVAPLDPAQYPFDVLAQTTSLSFDLNGEQSVASWARIYADVNFTTNTSDSRQGAPRVEVDVPTTNAYNNLGFPVGVGYIFGREVQTGLLPSPDQISDQKALEAVLGIEMSLPRSWNLDISASHSREDDYVDVRALDYSLLAARVSGVDGQGNPVPVNQQLNLFGNGTAQSPAALAGLVHGDIPGFFSDDDYATTDSVLLTAEGRLLSVPGGRVQTVAGAEFRRESLNENEPQYPVFSTSHPSRTIKAVFEEMNVPLIGQQQRIPGIYSLNLYGAGRWEQYAFSGPFDGLQAPDREVRFGHVSPKAGLSWYPSASLKLRATFSESFRAPSFGDLFGAPASLGVVAPVVDPQNPQLGMQSPPFLELPNPRVSPETARNYTAGLDWQPAEGPHGLAVTLNYNRIDILNRITNTAEFFYDPDVFFNLSGAVTRGSGGQITQISFLPINLGLRHSQSLDARADYSIDTRFGRLTFGFSGTYTLELEDVAIPGSAPQILAGTENGPEKFKVHGWVGWSTRDWGINLRSNFSSRYSNTNDQSLLGPESVAPYKTLDLTGFYNAPAGFSINLGVRNLTNAAYPFYNNSYLPWDPRRVDLRGRIFYLEVTSRSSDLFH